MSDRNALRTPAALLLGGFITYVVVTFLHTGGPANDHKVIFDDYAGSRDWAAVHLGQFIGMATIVAGLVALHVALDIRAGTAAWLARFGAIAAGIALGLYGVLQAVDGVALKQAVDAWVGAPAADKAARFATAETVRWLEWGSRSYQCFTLGLALILLGTAVTLSKRLPKTIGLLMGLSGASYLAQGWVLGSHGFDDDNSVAILVSYALMLTWTTWLAVVAWRRRRIQTDSATLPDASADAPAGR
ncbi:DUF4386 family protein [Actinopolymorpha rutila]|uniref:DUF4386 family protein n=1 Tax=Actinopolymorpha rutila TaxID=446787 RepID=A0A852ZDA3_9ACTN|nr:DUF4386 family protein [Actinopolymorpha rutila]NYH87679.1 hypothetical protein [Actinopolymorpha rutila]